MIPEQYQKFESSHQLKTLTKKAIASNVEDDPKNYCILSASNNTFICFNRSYDQSIKKLIHFRSDGFEINSLGIESSQKCLGMLRSNQLIILQPNADKISIWNIDTNNKQSFDHQFIKNQQVDIQKDVKLYTFSETKIFCIVEIIRNSNKLLLTYYQYKVNSKIIKIRNYQSDSLGNRGRACKINEQSGMMIFKEEQTQYFQFKIIHSHKQNDRIFYADLNQERIIKRAWQMDKEKLCFVSQSNKNKDKLNFITATIKDNAIELCKDSQFGLPESEKQNITNCFFFGQYLLLVCTDENSSSSQTVYYINNKKEKIYFQELWSLIEANQFKDSRISNLKDVLYLNIQMNKHELQQISNSCQKGMKIIRKSIEEVFPREVEPVLRILSEIQSSKEQLKEVIILLGPSNAGKTTILYHLCGDKLKLIFNDRIDVHELQPEHEQRYAAVHDYTIKKEYNIPNIRIKGTTLLVDMPQWEVLDHYEQIYFQQILQNIFHHIQTFKFVMVIEEETSPIDIEKEFTSLFKYILNQPPKQHFQDYFSLIVTKSREQYDPQSLTNKIQQIQQINPEIAERIQNILTQGRVYGFEERQYEPAQGNELFKTISQSQTCKTVNYILKFEEIFPDKKTLQENQMQIERKVSKYLLFLNNSLQLISSIIENQFHEEIDQDFQRFVQFLYQDQKHISQKFSNEASSKTSEHISMFLNQIKKIQFKKENTLEFIKILAKILEKSPHQNSFRRTISEFIEKIKNESNIELFKNFCKLFESIGVWIEGATLMKRTINQKSNEIELLEKVLFNSIAGFFSISLKPLLTKCSEIEDVANSSQFKMLMEANNAQKQVQKIKVSGEVIIKTIKRQEIKKLSYLEEKGKIIERMRANPNASLEQIFRMPPNALQLELLLDILEKQWINKDKATIYTDKDYKKFNRILKTLSSICQLHQFYREAIIFLIVIPDYNGIEDLLTDYVKNLKKSKLFDRNLLQSKDGEVLGVIEKMANQFLRIQLSEKIRNIFLINKTLEEREAQKKRLKRQKEKDFNSYKNKLDRRDLSYIFYDKNQFLFTQLLGKRQKESLIEKCKDFYKNPAYESYESLTWIMTNEANHYRDKN